MSELGFRIFNSAYGIGADLAYAVLLAVFFLPFISARSRKWQKFLIVFSICILCELLCNRASLPRGSFLLLLTAALLAVSKWIGMERSMAFLLTVLYFNARISAGLIVESLYFIMERLLPSPFEPLEACEKVGEGERFIALTGKRKGRFFLIEVKNAFTGEVVFGQDGLPVTTKTEDAPMHGLGLSNVRRVRRYGDV